MSGAREMPPLQLQDATRTPVDAERVTVCLTGTRRPELPLGPRLLLLVELDGRRHRFPALPQARQSVGEHASEFEARFTVPAWLATDLDGRMTLLAGDTALPVPRLNDSGLPPAPATGEPKPPLPGASSARPAPSAGGGQADPLGPLRGELTERAGREARLRAEVAELRARVEQGDPAGEQMRAMADELAAELVRVRELVTAEGDRRRAAESEAAGLAGDLVRAEGDRDAARAELSALRGEGDHLRAQTVALEHEVKSLDAELARLRAAETTAAAAREAVLAEVAALRVEVERLGTERGRTSAAEGSPPELRRAEALLAEARELRAALE